MDYMRLVEIEKPYFSHEEVADLLAIKKQSAAVLCARYVKKGLLIRLKRDLYVRTETIPHLRTTDLYGIANLLQVPSYISLTTALSHYGISTQLQRGFVESISIKRTKAFERGGIAFRYFRVRTSLYSGFLKDQGVFIASPEKALLDAVYLASMGRYSLDAAALDLGKIDRKNSLRMAAEYPARALKFLERLHEETGRSREP